MYNDEIKVANKIISDDALAKIFERMYEEIIENKEICKKETKKNEKLDRLDRHFTTKDFEGIFKVVVDFYDDTNITFDNYNDFIKIFNTRLSEIKYMWLKYGFNYSKEDGRDSKYISQYINMDIYEDKMNIDVSLSSEDKKMNNIYKLIKDTILSSPTRYDDTIKNKNIIINKISLILGIIPSIIISTVLMFIPVVRNIYFNTYILYPILVIVLGFILGNMLFSGSIKKLYKNISPTSEYIGYDSYKNKSIYKDDINSYKEKSEIIIGKNINNIKDRKEINYLNKKYNKYIPIEISVIIVLSIIMIIIGMFMK